MILLDVLRYAAALALIVVPLAAWYLHEAARWRAERPIETARAWFTHEDEVPERVRRVWEATPLGIYLPPERRTRPHFEPERVPQARYSDRR